MEETFIFATLAKFILVEDGVLDSSVGSLGLVNTPASDVVRIFEANGLYSPVVVTLVGVGVADEAMSKEDNEETEEVDETSGGDRESDEEVEDGSNGIR